MQIRKGRPNTFGNIVYVAKYLSSVCFEKQKCMQSVNDLRVAYV